MTSASAVEVCKFERFPDSPAASRLKLVFVRNQRKSKSIILDLCHNQAIFTDRFELHNMDLTFPKRRRFIFGQYWCFLEKIRRSHISKSKPSKPYVPACVCEFVLCFYIFLPLYSHVWAEFWTFSAESCVFYTFKAIKVLMLE